MAGAEEGLIVFEEGRSGLVKLTLKPYSGANGGIRLEDTKSVVLEWLNAMCRECEYMENNSDVLTKSGRGVDECDIYSLQGDDDDSDIHGIVPDARVPDAASGTDPDIRGSLRVSVGGDGKVSMGFWMSQGSSALDWEDGPDRLGAIGTLFSDTARALSQSAVGAG